MTDVDKEVPKKVNKRTTKSCLSCGSENPIAKKSCCECGNPFPKKQKNWEKIYNKGATNITKQRELMEFRADTLQHHHDCDVVILMHHKHGNGSTINFYGTKGPGVSFIGNKADTKTSRSGTAALECFRTFMEGYKSSRETTTTQPTNQPSAIQPSSATIQPTNQPSTNQTAATTNQTATTQPTNASSTTKPPSVINI